MEEKHWIRISVLYLCIAAIGYPILDVLDKDPNEIGDYVAGFLTPLALLWLILGYRQQGKELEQNTKQLALQVRELNDSVKAQTRQAESIEANTQHAERDVFLQLAESITQQLEVRAIRFFRDFDLATFRNTHVAEINNLHSVDVLAQYILNRFDECVRKLSARGNESLLEPIEAYKKDFEYLIQQAGAVDSTGVLKEYYLRSSYGKLNEEIKGLICCVKPN